MAHHTRRGFLCGCSAAIAAMSGVRFSSLAFGAVGGNSDVLVVVFLRGGVDGMNVVPPIAGPDRGHYQTYRPALQVPVASALNLGNGFGLHPACSPLLEAWQEGNLAVVHAAGLNSDITRSHFESMDNIELGTPGETATPTGWLTRHLVSARNLPSAILMPALSVGSIQATSLLGELNSVNMADPDSFDIDTGPWEWNGAHHAALRQLFTNGSTPIHVSGQKALDAIDIIQAHTGGGYTPANGAGSFYDQAGSFGDHLSLVAQMIKEPNLGLRVATVDLGGWDTHNGQGDGAGGYFASLLGDLAYGLAGLYRDLDVGGATGPFGRTTVVVLSEFGRRLRENDDRGTDHGHGNRMLLFGGRVNGGFHGVWPGLAVDELFEQADLAVTVDFRRVLSEVLIRRLGNPRIEEVFPGYGLTYVSEGPLGVVEGTDLPVDFSTPLFNDDFESGDLSAWSSAVGTR